MNTRSQDFQKAVLQWFDRYGRKDLPWQENKTPYRVWISEIMLQQTQVTTVIPYFLKFIERFPTVQSLAKASQDEVLHLWTGLGYYTRARNLHRTAKILHETYQDKFPNELDDLIQLPGIGRSTAGAILAIAFEKQATILDGNVKRVLTRFLGMTEWPGEKKITDQLWQFAEKFTPSSRVANYTQAMMDIGATVCIRGKPRCEQCPLEKHCQARLLGIEKSLPHPKPRKSIPVRQTNLLILQHQDSILLEKRAASGIWGGLWSLPEITTTDLNDLKKICWQRFHCKAENITVLENFRHTFSHFHLDISPIQIFVKNTRHKIMDGAGQIWYNLHEPAIIGLPAPIKLLLSNLS